MLILFVVIAAAIWIFIDARAIGVRALIDRAWANDFAEEWIDTWNSHDLERILSHKDPNGVLRRKAAIREY